MNIGTVLIEHDYNTSPLKGRQTFSVERPSDAERRKRGIGLKKTESKGFWTKRMEGRMQDKNFMQLKILRE